MALYRYRAQDNSGKKITGRLQAQDENDLHEKLKNEEKYLISAEVVEEVKNVKPLKASQLSEFSRQIGTLVGSGVSLVRALRMIADEETNGAKEKAIYESVLVMVRQGIPLSEAMQAQHGAFSPLLINMYRSAEVSGNLDKIALRMAGHFEKEHRLNSKVKSAMTYPKILGVLIVAVVIVIMAYVIPQFESMFEQMEELPATTTVLLAVSDFVAANWVAIIIVGVIAILALKLIFIIPKVRLVKDRILLHMPLLGKQQKIVCTARFARTLSSLYSSGIPIVTALEIARKTIGNYYIDWQFDEVIIAVRTGGSLSTAVGNVDGFINKLPSSIRVGEETGSLDSMLNSIADNLEYEAEVAIRKMVSYLEPVMIIVMAVIVGFIMISVIGPIYGSYETIGGSTY